MAMDKYAKLEMQLRNAFRVFWTDKLSKGRQKAMYIPKFLIPRSEKVDLILGPKEGTTICLTQRSDYVGVYRHTVGQMIGALAHYHQMTDRQIREALRVAKVHPDVAELKQSKIDAVRTSKRLISDKKSGKLSVILVTEVPEVPQQAKELEANFMPLAALLKVWMCSAIKRKKLCKTVDFYAVSLGPDEESNLVLPLKKAIATLTKELAKA